MAKNDGFWRGRMADLFCIECGNRTSDFSRFQAEHNVYAFRLLIFPITIVFVLPLLNSILGVGGALSTDFIWC